MVESIEKLPHRSIFMGNDLGSDGRYRQFRKLDIDEIFATSGWKPLSMNEAQEAIESGHQVFGLYDPLETVGSRSDSRMSARIVTSFSQSNQPKDFKPFKSLVYYLEENNDETPLEDN